jgi:hypothetical protein
MSITTTAPATITIRRPTAPREHDTAAPTFSVDKPIGGLRVGLRTDLAWRSWAFIADDWQRRLRAEGATAVPIETGSQVGDAGSSDRAKIAAWSDDVDCGIVGLGTCGSCTSFSVHDAVTVEQHHKPSIVVVCSEFETHARNMARFLGHGDLRVLVLPYPLEARPDDELLEISESFYPQALAALGVQR